jgi:hypothetical protein
MFANRFCGVGTLRGLTRVGSAGLLCQSLQVLNNKHSSLLCLSIYYGAKRFYNIGLSAAQSTDM